MRLTKPETITHGWLVKRRPRASALDRVGTNVLLRWVILVHDEKWPWWDIPLQTVMRSSACAGAILVKVFSAMSTLDMASGPSRYLPRGAKGG